MRPAWSRARLTLRGASRPAVEGSRSLVLVPVGSLEQHGPHLPLGTDTMVAVASCRCVAERLAGEGVSVWVAPAVEYGASGEHEDFPGTISIGHQALRLMLVELGRSACRWAGGLIFVNGHGGNDETVADAVLQLREEGRAVAWTSCATPGGDAHAGRAETSLLLALAPGLVDLDAAAAAETEPIEELLPRLRRLGVRAVSPNGVLGDPTGASAAEGRWFLARIADRLHAELSDIDVDRRGRLVAAARVGAP
ncbi:MAG: mycofactocin biosynthesis peptidyl-dipeptidase MftE [Nocardioides sp.]